MMQNGRIKGCWRAQVGCAYLVHLPLMFIALKHLNYFEKNCNKFSGHSENFSFWDIFLLHEKFRKQARQGIYFI